MNKKESFAGRRLGSFLLAIWMMVLTVVQEPAGYLFGADAVKASAYEELSEFTSEAAKEEGLSLSMPEALGEEAIGSGALRLICGMEEHQHTDDCYQSRTKRKFHCPYEESGDVILHRHGEECYEDGVLICPFLESPDLESLEGGPLGWGENAPQVAENPLAAGGDEPAFTADDWDGPEACEGSSEYPSLIFGSDASLFGEGVSLPLTRGAQLVGTEGAYSAYQEEGILGLLIYKGDKLLPHVHGQSCFDAEGNLICDKAQAVVHHHTPECYDLVEEQVLTCGLEEHIHEESCYETVLASVGEEEELGDNGEEEELGDNGEEEELGDIGELEDIGEIEEAQEEREGALGEEEDTFGAMQSQEEDFLGETPGQFQEETGEDFFPGAEDSFVEEETSQQDPFFADQFFAEAAEEDPLTGEDSLSGEDFLSGEASLAGEAQEGFVNTLIQEGEGYTVRLSYDERSQIPEGAYLQVEEVVGDAYASYLSQAKQALGVEDVERARFFDIKILKEDGEGLSSESDALQAGASETDAQETKSSEEEALESGNLSAALEEALEGENLSAVLEEALEGENLSAALEEALEGENLSAALEEALEGENLSAALEEGEESEEEVAQEESSEESDRVISPKAPVKVEILYQEAVSNATANVLHFGEEVEVLSLEEVAESALDEGVASGEAGISGVSFMTDSFSVFGVIYTVDFHYGEGEFDFSIIGGNTISMKELAARLHLVEVQDQAALDAALAELHPEPVEEVIPEDDEDETDAEPNEADPASAKPAVWPQEIEDFVANIASVQWTNPEVATVAKIEQQITVGDLVDSLGLVNQFSADMTDSQIEAAMNLMLAEGDWAFISTQPFLTEEKLTITLNNGDVYEIGVTDAYVRANTTVRNPSVKIKTAGKYLNASGNLVADESARIPSNLNFTVKANGTASVAGKFVNTAGTFYYIPDQLEYNGEWYQVTDIHVLTPAAINGRHVIFDDDLPAHMLGATTEALPDIIDHLTAQMLVDAGIVTAAEVSAAGYSSAQNLTDDQVAALVNGSSTDYEVGTHKESRNLFDLFKQAQYDVETNKVTISMKYFQKMKRDVPLDFIFVYDDSGTMASAATNAGSFGYTYSASQSVWCRIVLQVILQGIMDWSEDNRDKTAQGYDIRMSPIAFADKAYYEKAFYDNYVDAKTSLGRIYTSGGTAHVNALNGCIDLARFSMSQQSTRTHEQRNPIVVYLSDFHSNANSTAAKRAANELRSLENTATHEKVHVYTIHMFERNFRYDRNIASDSDSMFITGDISEMLGVFDTITKDAIGYFVAKNIAVQDTVSPNLAGMAQSMTVNTASGAVTKSGNTSNWVISSGERLRAGVVYTQTIEIQMKDNVVFSPSMASNESARVIKSEEDDDGNINPVIVNQIDTQPKPKGGLRMILGLLDENGSKTNNVITGAGFELYKNGTKIWEGTTAAASTADGINAGEISIPYSAAPFAAGETYTLKQISTNEDIALMPVPGVWTLTVRSNYQITSSNGGESETPAMTVSNGEFHIWNKSKTNTLTVLVPVVIKKVWDGYTPASGDSISFTVLGKDGSGGTVELPAYKTNNRTADDFDELDTVTTLSASDRDINDTPWTKIVYVPATNGEGSAKLTFFDTVQNSYTNGYTVREDGLAVSAPDGEWTQSIDSTGTVPGENYTYYTYEGQEGWQTVSGKTGNNYYLFMNDNSYNENNNRSVKQIKIELTYNSNETATLYLTFNTVQDLHLNSYITSFKLPSEWTNPVPTKIYFRDRITDNWREISFTTTNSHGSSVPYIYYQVAFYQDTHSGHAVDTQSIEFYGHAVDTQSIEFYGHATATPHTATGLAKQILQVTNTFTPYYTIRFGSQWVDESEDSASTANAIDAVTYTILKDGQPYGDPITVEKGDTLDYPATPGSIRVPAGTYTIRQTSYTLANGEVVSTATPEEGQADTYQFAAYEVTNDKDGNSGGSYAVTVGSGTTAPVELKFTNTRKQFTANVHTVWDPDHEYYDGDINYTLRYTILTNDGGTYKLTNHSVPGVNNDGNGWSSSHNNIPRYGINGVETVCDVDPNALDALVAFYETDTSSVIDSSGNMDFTITNTERRVTFSVRKDWLDAEGQEIPEADRKPVTIEIWGIEKDTGEGDGGYTPGQGVIPPAVLRLDPSNYPSPFDTMAFETAPDSVRYTVRRPSPNGFFYWDGDYYVVEGNSVTLEFEASSGEFRAKNVVGTGRLLKFTGRVITPDYYDDNGAQLHMKQSADVPLDDKVFKEGDIVIWQNKYWIERETPGQWANTSTLVNLGWGDIEAVPSGSGGAGATQTEYPHSTQFEVDTLITSEHASQFDAGTKRVKADGVTAEYTIPANDGWTRSFELPARYVYFAREVKVGTLPLENEDNTENLENLAMFSPYYDYDQGAVTVAISNRFPIARVSNDGGANWHYFDTLLTVHAENYPEHQGAFNYANTLSGNVEIELLRRTNPFYTMKSGFTFDTPTNVTLRTTQDTVWNPGDTKFTSAIYRGYNGTSLITFSKAGGSFSVEKITLDGNKNSVKDEEGNEIASFTGSASGGLISITGATLNIRDGATLQNSKLDNNMDGGAVYAQNSTVSMTGGLIQNNEVVGEGGGIYLDGTINTEAQAAWRVYVANTGSSMTMTGGTIKGNKADLVGNTKGQGGGVYVSATGSLTMSGGSIEENTASMGGGVQTGYNGGFTMNDGTIARNIANSGGGICQWSDTPGTINGGTLTGNSATARGSAIYVVGGNTFNINGGRITDNNVAVSDGAVSIENGSSRLNFSGSAFVYGNVDGSAQKNVVLGYESSDDDTGNYKNGVIRMTGSFTDEAHVGIWIPDALQTAHDQPAKPFGYYADATYENEEKFTSDRQPGLIAVMGTNHTLYWADYIARVKTDTGTDAQKAWKYFEALIDVKEGNAIVIPSAFNYAQTLGGNVVIETLKETHARYTLPESFTFSNSPDKTGVTLRTTEGAAFQTTLKRGYDEDKAGSLINVHDIDMTISNIAFDGNGQFGRAVEIGDTSSSNIKHGTLTVTDGASFRNFNTVQRPTYTEGSKTSDFDAKGGVINANQGTSLTITGTAAKPIVFENNTLTNTNTTGKMGADGGAICAEFDCVISIDYAQFVNNTATSANGTDKGTGGAISLAGTNKGTTANKVKLTVSNSTFSGNSAKQEGGAIRAWDKTDVTLTNCTFTGNTATNGDGGAVFVQSTNTNPSELKIYGGSFTGNTAANGTGGAVCFARNSGDTAGSGRLTIAKNGNAAAIFGDSTDEGKNTAANGGAICVYGSTATITDAVINKNSATNEGGGIKAYGGTLTVDGATKIQNCTAAHGGGIHTMDTALTVQGSTEISGCTVTGFGGGIYIYGDTTKAVNQQKTVQITGSTKITNCYAGWNGTDYNATGDGGGVNIAFGASATIDGSVEISGCKAVYGGGVNVEWTYSQNICAGTIGGSVVISGCEAKTAGSGVYVYDHSSLTMSGGQIGGNTVSDSVGAVQVGGENARLIFSGNAKVTGNTYTSGESSVSKNVYLEQNTDLIINTSGLGEEALIGVHAKDGAVFTARGENGKVFGSQTSTTNLNHFRNDVTGALGEDAGSGKVRWQLVSIPLVPVNVEKVWASAIPDGTTSVGFQIYGITNTTAGTKVALDAYDADIDTSDSTAVAAHKVTELKASEGWKKLVYVPQYGSDGTGNKIFFVDSDTGEYHYSIEELNKPEGYEAVETIIPGRTIPGETVEANTVVEVPVDTYTSYPYTFYAEFNVDSTYQGFFPWQDRYPVLRTMVISFSHKQNPEIKYTLHLDLTPTQTEGTGKYYVRVKSPTGYIGNYKLDSIVLNGGTATARNISLITQKQLDQLNVYSFVNSTPTKFTQVSTEPYELPSTVEPAVMRITNRIDQTLMVPLIIQKKWDLPIGKSYDSVPFTVYGVKGTTETALTAYSVSVPTTGKEVTRLTESDTCPVPKDDGTGSETATWAKMVYVPRQNSAGENYGSYTVKEPNISTVDAKAVWDPEVTPAKAQWEEVTDANEYTDAYIRLTRTGVGTNKTNEYTNISKVKFYFWDATKDNYYCSSLDFASSNHLSWNTSGTKYCLKIRVPKSLDLSGAQLMFDSYNDEHKPTVVDLSKEPSMKAGVDGDTYVYGIEAQAEKLSLPAFKMGTMDTHNPSFDDVVFLSTYDGSDVITGTQHLYTFPHVQPNARLIVTNHSYICKIVEKNGDTVVAEHGFTTLNKAVTWARDHGNGTAMSSSNPVKIEMLVDYEIPESDKVTLSNANDNIVFTTAETSVSATMQANKDIFIFAPTFTASQGRTTEYKSDGTYKSGDSVGTAILRRGYTGASLIESEGSALLTVRNLIFDGNKGSSYTANTRGGAIHAHGTSVYLYDTEIRNSKSTGGDASYGSGGGAYLDCPTSVVTNCSFKSCEGGFNGGGVCMNHNGQTATKAELNGVSFESCVVTGSGSGHSGGGAYMWSQGSVANGVTFKNCHADGDKGGGLYFYGKNSKIGVTYAYTDESGSQVTASKASSFENCTAKRGGGVQFYDANGEISGENDGNLEFDGEIGGTDEYPITFKNCEAKVEYGGGVAFYGKAKSVHHMSFDGCKAKTHGGGIGINGGITNNASFSKLEFKDCTAESNGGALYIKQGSPTMSDVTIDGHDTTKAAADRLSADTKNAVSGGGIYVEGGNLTVNGLVIKNTYATNGGAVYMNNGTLTVGVLTEGVTEEIRSSITDCKASSNGGAIYVNAGGATLQGGTGGSATVHGVTITGCSSTSGGAMDMHGSNTVAFTFGGNVYVYDNPTSAENSQKNVVLNQDNATSIKTTADGLTENAHIGIYAADANNAFANHGKYEQDFGTIGTKNSQKGNSFLYNFTNDRNGLFGMECNLTTTGHSHSNIIRWQSYVCKLTTDGGSEGTDKLLYSRSGSGTQADPYVYKPAVYNSLTEGFANANGVTLYTLDSSGNAQSYAATQPIKVKVLRDYAMENGSDSTASVSYNNTARDLTFTTAERSADGEKSPYYYANTVTDTASEQYTRATLTRSQTTASMFTFNMGKNLFVNNLIVDGGDKAATAQDVNGGAFCLQNVNAASFEDMTIRNVRTSGNGGAIYANAGTTTLVGATITGNQASGGGGVYAASGAEIKLPNTRDDAGNVTAAQSSVITGNSAATAGAGIYLAEGSKLSMEGSPSFGGTGTADSTGANPAADISGPPATGAVTNGNYLTGTLTGHTNGQKTYTRERQDIYIESTADVADSIVLTGALGTTASGTFTAMTPGSIWIGAASEKHHKMLTQFAVLDDSLLTKDGDGKITGIDTSKITQAQLEAVYLVFRNAQTDAVSECGGDYLTGQEGDTVQYIKWTGGFDFVFRKIGSDGNPLPGATFTLYMSVKDGDKYVPAKADGTVATSTDGSDWAAYQQTDKTNGGKKAATATSGSGTQSEPLAGTDAAHAVTIKVNKGTAADPVLVTPDPSVYGAGIAVFEKIPPGVYFMKETTFPTVSGTTLTYEPTPPEKAKIYMVDLNGKGYFNIYVEGDDGNYTTEAPTVLFMNDGSAETGKSQKYAPPSSTATTTDTLSVYNLMNVYPRIRKVILRKVDGTDYTSLEGAHFRIFRADLTEIYETYKAGDTIPEGKHVGDRKSDYYESYDFGVYFSGKLPLGTYYLVETQAPNKANGATTSVYSGNLGKVFELNVTASGMNQKLETTEKVSNVGAELESYLKTWLAAKAAS